MSPMQGQGVQTLLQELWPRCWPAVSAGGLNDPGARVHAHEQRAAGKWVRLMQFTARSTFPFLPGHPQGGWEIGAAAGWLPKLPPAGILLDSATKEWMAEPRAKKQ